MKTTNAWGLVALALAGCGGTTNEAARDTLRPLERVRALRVMREALGSRGLAVELSRRARLAGGHEIDCDVAIASTRYCFEYVNATDRATYGDAIPPRTNADALVVAPGAGPDAAGGVLALDDRDYLYEPDPRRAGEGHPSVGEVEDRMRRAALDFVAWLRSQGRL